jgi:hypothetical protein
LSLPVFHLTANCRGRCKGSAIRIFLPPRHPLLGLLDPPLDLELPEERPALLELAGADLLVEDELRLFTERLRALEELVFFCPCFTLLLELLDDEDLLGLLFFEVSLTLFSDDFDRVFSVFLMDLVLPLPLFLSILSLTVLSVVFGDTRLRFSVLILGDRVLIASCDFFTSLVLSFAFAPS